MMQNVAFAFARKIEIGMVRQVQHRVLVCRRRVVDLQFIAVRRPREHHLYREIARKSFLSIRAQIRELQRFAALGSNLSRLPDFLVKSNNSAVERIVAVILRKRVRPPINREFSAPDAIPIPSHRLAEVSRPVLITSHPTKPPPNTPHLPPPPPN